VAQPLIATPVPQSAAKALRLARVVFGKLAEKLGLEVSQVRGGAAMRQLLGQFQLLLPAVSKKPAKLDLLFHEALAHFFCELLPICQNGVVISGRVLIVTRRRKLFWIVANSS
jgi:hypothetical protein